MADVRGYSQAVFDQQEAANFADFVIRGQEQHRKQEKKERQVRAEDIPGLEVPDDLPDVWKPKIRDLVHELSQKKLRVKRAYQAGNTKQAQKMERELTEGQRQVRDISDYIKFSHEVNEKNNTLVNDNATKFDDRELRERKEKIGRILSPTEDTSVDLVGGDVKVNGENGFKYFRPTFMDAPKDQYDIRVETIENVYDVTKSTVTGDGGGSRFDEADFSDQINLLWGSNAVMKNVEEWAKQIEGWDADKLDAALNNDPEKVKKRYKDWALGLAKTHVNETYNPPEEKGEEGTMGSWLKETNARPIGKQDVKTGESSVSVLANGEWEGMVVPNNTFLNVRFEHKDDDEDTGETITRIEETEGEVQSVYALSDGRIAANIVAKKSGEGEVESRHSVILNEEQIKRLETDPKLDLPSGVTLKQAIKALNKGKSVNTEQSQNNEGDTDLEGVNWATE